MNLIFIRLLAPKSFDVMLITAAVDFLTLEHIILWRKDLVCFAILTIILCPSVEDVRPHFDD